jgi:hypothetical protein
MPVLGALARWGYDWTWGAPRPGEDVNIGAIFRLAPGMLTPPENVSGTVELVVDARGDLPERRYQLSLADGHVEMTELAQAETEPDARVSGPVSAWVSALGPGGGAGDLQFSGKRQLADAVLDGFSQAGARRAAAAA